MAFKSSHSIDSYFPDIGDVYDDAFFAKALARGGDYFESAVMHLAARGDHASVHQAILFMARDDHSRADLKLIDRLLWMSAHSVEVCVLSKGKMIDTFVDIGGLHQAVVLSLFLKPLHQQEVLSSIRSSRIDVFCVEDWSNQLANAHSLWTPEKQGVLQSMLDLCRNRSGFQIKKDPLDFKPNHPAGHLLEAVIERSPLDEPAHVILQGLEVDLLKRDLCLHATVENALQQGRVQLVTQIINAYPAWGNNGSGENEAAHGKEIFQDAPHEARSTLGAGSQTRSKTKTNQPTPSLGVAEGLSNGRWLSAVHKGLFEEALNERSSSPDSSRLLPSEERACALIRLVCRRENKKSADVLIGCLAAHLSLARRRMSNWSAPLVNELCALLDVELGVKFDSDPWPLEPAQTNREKNKEKNSHQQDIVHQLIKLSFGSQCVPVMMKLAKAFDLLSDKRAVSLAWSNFNKSNPPTPAAFSRSMRQLQLMGVDLSAPHAPDEDPRWSVQRPWATNKIHQRRLARAARLIRLEKTEGADAAHPSIDLRVTPLISLATSDLGYDAKINLMQPLLDLGVNPHIKDHRGWSVASYLPKGIRSQWQDRVRSHEAKTRAKAALASICEDEVSFIGNAPCSSSKGARP